MTQDLSYRFIDDLIPLVLESGHWWPLDLAILCRVSAPWLYQVRRALYRCPHLTAPHQCLLFSRSLKENASLCSLVKGVRLHLMPSRYPACAQATYLESLRTILGVDGIESITLGGELAISAGRYLHLVTTPGTVTSLHIEGGPALHTRRPSLEWNESLALKFTSLRSLHVSDLTLDVDVEMSMLPYRSMLHTLVLENVDLSYGRLTALVNENTILERVHITTEDASDYGDDIREILMSCEVHSLEYKVINEHRFGTLFDNDMEPLPHLKRLRLEGIYVDRDVLECIAELCTGLEELEVDGMGVGVRQAEVAEVVGR